MKLRLNRFSITINILLMCLSTFLYAENNEDVTLDLQLGLVASMNTRFYQGVGDEYQVLPLLIAEFGGFYLQGIDVGYRFYQRDGQKLAIEIGRTFEGYESSDARFLSGMSKREAAWEAGLVYERTIGSGQFKGKLMQDVGGSHEGFSSLLEYSRRLWVGESYWVSWFFGGDYWNKKKTDYYFGVDKFEARQSRAAYSASDSYSLFVGVNAIKKLSSKYSFVFNAEYRQLSDAVILSPLVSQDDQWSAYAGIFYQF